MPFKRAHAMLRRMHASLTKVRLRGARKPEAQIGARIEEHAYGYYGEHIKERALFRQCIPCPRVCMHPL